MVSKDPLQFNDGSPASHLWGFVFLPRLDLWTLRVYSVYFNQKHAIATRDSYGGGITDVIWIPNDVECNLVRHTIGASFSVVR